MPKATKKTTKKAPMYDLTVKVLGRLYTSKGKTLEEAIEKLDVGSGAKGMSIFTVKKGDKTQEKIFTSIATARLFGAGGATTRGIIMKQALQMFNI